MQDDESEKENDFTSPYIISVITEIIGTSVMMIFGKFRPVMILNSIIYL